MKRAVVIAGDYRTFMHSIKSAFFLFEGADIYVSVWSTSSCGHNNQKRLQPYHIFDRISEDAIREVLKPYEVRDIKIERFSKSYWTIRGYNSGFLHRMRCGVDMVNASGEKYDSVLFMRPDMFFGEGGDTPELMAPVEEGTFKTIWSNEERVKKQRTVNDTLFIVRQDDMDKAIPSVIYYQKHQHEDWHTFYCAFVEGNGLRILNLEDVRCAILRPPSRPDMTFDEASKTSVNWDRVYIIDSIRARGLMQTIRDWHVDNVQRAILGFIDEDYLGR